MKVRTRFVSNSSSSSFYCPICGETDERYGDVSIQENDMYRCEQGHSFHIDCLTDGQKITLEEFADAREFSLENIPRELCPICSLEIIPKTYMDAYIRKTVYIPLYEEEIREAFKNIDELYDFIWGD
jgi:predicted RNA-binding Zn-ribbon protein involved in translation (DUF1610 family)